MIEKLRLFIEENYEPPIQKARFQALKQSLFEEDHASFGAPLEYAKSVDIEEFINDHEEDNFQTILFKLIDERGLKDSDVYNKVHIDRRLFSKIRSDSSYHPSKETIILLGLSLELSLDEILTLLESASYSLPKNNYFDLIIRFCFLNKIYKLKDVNELLDEYNCKLFSY